MVTFTCEKCKNDINYKDRVQKLDLAGYTHTYCTVCAAKVENEKAPPERDL